MPEAEGRQADLPRGSALAAALVAAAVYIVVAWNSTAPVFFTDEVGNLGVAKLFADPQAGWLLTGASYMPGFSVMLTPAWWISSDPLVVYRLAIVLGVLLSLATIVPLAALARRFGAAPRVSWVVAAIVMAAPARALNANYVWAEMLLFLAVAWTIELAFRLPNADARLALTFGAVAGVAFAAHGRALPFAILAIGCGAWLARRSLANVAAVVLGGAATTGGAYGLFLYASSSIYVGSDRVSSTLDGIRSVTVSGYLETVASEAWYQIAAWAGLTVIGLGVVLRVAWRERLRGPSTVFVALAMAMALAAPVLIADSEGLLNRIDAHFYGRYLDPFVAVLAVVGLARLTRPVRVRWALALAASAVASAGIFVLAIAPGIPAAVYLTPIHVAGVAYLLHPDYVLTGQAENWGVVAFGAIAAAVVVAAASMRRLVAVGIAGAWLVAVTVWTDTRMFDFFEAPQRSQPAVAAAAAPIDTDVDLYADYTDQYAYGHGNQLTFWVAPRRYVYIDPSKGTSGVAMLLSSDAWDAATGSGARPLDAELPKDAVVWIMPGSLQDDLASGGRLGPAPQIP